MFAIAFDLVVADTAEHHPRGVTAVYANIGAAWKRHGFERIQGSVYVCENNDMANPFAALLALKALPWVAQVVRDIRGFRIENWSNFTPIIKGSQPA